MSVPMKSPTGQEPDRQYDELHQQLDDYAEDLKAPD